MTKFMFATGIECSYPTLDGGRYRMDELEATDHYRYWRRDLELVRELGLRYLRYGPPLHRIYLGPGKYDWSFMDDVCQAMQELEITPIMDLCHFGLPDWLENFQNRQFPKALGEPERARGKPWIPLGLAGKALAHSLMAAKLTWDQWAKHKAFCFWCLLAAAATFATLPLTFAEVRAALEHLLGRRSRVIRLPPDSRARSALVRLRSRRRHGMLLPSSRTEASA